MAIGRKLDALLKERNLKPGTLASLTGINKNTIYAIIKRDSEKVNMAALHKIADALHISIDYFFDPFVEEYISEEAFLSEMAQHKTKAPAHEMPERNEIAMLYLSLTEENQRRLLDYAQLLLRAQQAEHDSQG